jgi:hypothetical protein
MDQLAPAAIVLAARLGAPEPSGDASGQRVVETAARRSMSVTPDHLENLAQHIRVGLAPGAVRPGQAGLIGG